MMMTSLLRRGGALPGAAITLLVLCALATDGAAALAAQDGAAAPVASPAPASTPRPPAVEIRGDLSLVYLTQAVAGPGLAPSDGTSFANGGPAAPMSPYDFFTSAPMSPGEVQQNQASLDGVWHAPGFAL
ncbi:MAG TPA: hypothetical protein VEJ20_01295, partial [Candidatus Eremiobacteraceae bacterium]|nr:hypothetical protein [Candidatus Eremiobacteraceae bacterium]